MFEAILPIYCSAQNIPLSYKQQVNYEGVYNVIVVAVDSQIRLNGAGFGSLRQKTVVSGNLACTASVFQIRTTLSESIDYI